MAKPKRKKRKSEGTFVPTPVDVTSLLASADALLPALEAGAGPEWGEVQRLLVKAKAAPDAVGRAVVSREPAAIRALIESIRNPDTTPAQPTPVQDGPEIPAETLREAMKAFKKRMKLTKLDHESKLGRSPLTSGKDASFDSILPPNQFSSDVWYTLVTRGDLVASGKGFFRFPDERKEF
jgi:hypothetical protein